jgi:hypothetical protein
MSEIKLSKSQRQLFKSWEAEYRSQLGAFSGVLNENLNLKLERIAEEMGIDLEGGKWTFDAQACAFTMRDEPTPKIPGRNAAPDPARNTTEDKDNVIDAEVVS